MSIRQLRFKDDWILRKKSGRVEVIDDNIRSILDDMAETMYAYEHGAGLSAVQIGVLKRLVVADVGDGLIKLINPEIMAQSGMQRSVEGCLSFPNTYYRVVRPKRMTVRALNENGEPIIINAENKLAVCLSHEIDHLNGVLFIDKAIKNR